MKHGFTKSWTVVLTLLALTFSAGEVTPAYAAGFVVTKTADTADGTCSLADCSLREAVIAANVAVGDDIITVPAGTYTLTIAGADENAAATGDLDLTSNITINGAGAGSTFIEGGTSLATSVDRVFHVTDAFTVNISGVTVRNGIGNNGGGIVQQAGTLTITNSTFSGNNVSGIGNGGGGIFHNVGTLTITDSTFSGNSASGGSGAGIYVNAGTATITNSTFSGNSAFVGGGIFNGGTLTITNSTFSGNSANDYYSYGGGIYRHSAGGAVTLRNTIVANSASGGNCSGTITDGGNNLDSANTCGFTTNAKINTDPNLGALANNGGPTQTFALLTGSPAIDAGDDTTCTTPPVNGFDQRGVPRPQGAACDIGAVEADPTPLTVTMSSTASNPTNISPIPVTVQFSETVTGFIAGDITPGNGSVGSFVAVDGDTYTFNLIPSAEGLVTANIAAGVASDLAGNGNTVAAQFSRTYTTVYNLFLPLILK